MANYLVFGRDGHLIFADEHEYYQTLGSLCHEGAYEIVFQDKHRLQKDAWKDAYRIKCLMEDGFVPTAFLDAMRIGRIVSCNNYVEELIECHNFNFDTTGRKIKGEYYKVLETVPDEYWEDFDDGYNFIFSIRTAIITKADIDSSKIKPYEKKEKNSTTSKVTTAIKKGCEVFHKQYGEGIFLRRREGTIYIKFKSGVRTFVPTAFEDRYLSLI